MAMMGNYDYSPLAFNKIKFYEDSVQWEFEHTFYNIAEFLKFHKENYNDLFCAYPRSLEYFSIEKNVTFKMVKAYMDDNNMTFPLVLSRCRVWDTQNNFKGCCTSLQSQTTYLKAVIQTKKKQLNDIEEKAKIYRNEIKALEYLLKNL